MQILNFKVFVCKDDKTIWKNFSTLVSWHSNNFEKKNPQKLLDEVEKFPHIFWKWCHSCDFNAVALLQSDTRASTDHKTI
jgi:hypothetical protein